MRGKAKCGGWLPKGYDNFECVKAIKGGEVVSLPWPEWRKYINKMLNEVFYAELEEK